MGVGLAGCGRMGLPMLQALQDAGFAPNGFDIRDVTKGQNTPVKVTQDSRAFSKGLTCLFTVVRDEAETDAVLFDVQGLVATAPNLKRIILSSTLSPRYVRELRGRIPSHIDLVDAPMSGAVIGAVERRLTFMVGGEDQSIAAVTPMLQAMGREIHVMGSFGAGAQTKVLNNLLAASHTAMTRLVLDWADTAGIAESKLLALIAVSSGQNWLASGMDEIEFARDGMDPENSIGILFKDVASALDAAPDNADLELPLAVQKTIERLKPRPNLMTLDPDALPESRNEGRGPDS